MPRSSFVNAVRTLGSSVIRFHPFIFFCYIGSSQ
jgi:hypothetical protein